MALRRRISYQWQLFIPLVVTQWALIIGVFFYKYQIGVELSTELMHRELSFVNARVISAYERNFDLRQFLDFMEHYLDNTIYEDLRVSVYDDEGKLLYNIGRPIAQSFDDNTPIPEVDIINNTPANAAIAIRPGIGLPGTFFNAARRSIDGKIYVHTNMPLNHSILNTLESDPMPWLLVVTIGIIVSLLGYVVTGYLVRNVRLLKKFAERAAADKEFVDTERFPHDELGDISREIISIYRQRKLAAEREEREHEAAIRAIEEKARIKRQLTNNINHELKTPIGIIKGYLDTVGDDPDMPESMKDSFIAKARQHMDRLCNLMTDVSTMTRLEEGEGVPTAEVDMNELVYRIDSDLRVSDVNGSMEFKFDIPVDCKVVGNYTLLNNMLMNLIKNAARYSQGTEMCLKVISANDRYYVFSFADNGNGVGEEHLPRLFERFYCVDAGRSRRACGTGLGLPIVKNTVIALGGTISVRNAVPHGLEFIFTLHRWSENNQNTQEDNENENKD